jgi:GNAT superfamily N-acetyltransferase
MRLTTVVAPIAELQLGLVARRQLLRHGVPPTTIDSAVSSGRLRPVHRAVYRLPGAPDGADVRLLAAVLAAGPGAVASHGTAAWLWDLAEPPRKHEISVPRGRRVELPAVEVHESTDLDLAGTGRVRGIPVTGVGRTILDRAGDPACDVGLLVDAARRRHDISRSLLPYVLVTHARSGRRGIERLRSVLEVDGLPASDFERLFARFLEDCGVPGWVMHHRLVLPLFGPVEVDFAWPDRRIALELEGRDHVDRRGVHDRDTERQNHLVLAGWTVLRLTYRRWLRAPDAVLAELLDVLAV